MYRVHPEEGGTIWNTAGGCRAIPHRELYLTGKPSLCEGPRRVHRDTLLYVRGPRGGGGWIAVCIQTAMHLCKYVECRADALGPDM